MRIYPYAANSGSVKKLCEGLGIKRTLREGNGIRTDCFVNWGCTRVHRDVILTGPEYRYLNHEDAVAIAHNKLKTFKALEGHVGIPEWTEEMEQVHDWFAAGHVVIARTILTGNSGAGIVVMDPEEYRHGVVPEAKLYTKYARQAQEYRVHVFQGKPIFLQRKARKKAVEDDKVNWKIRNHANGFIFAHKDVQVPEEVQEQSIRAVDVLGLDFGAVDVALGKDGNVYVFEVNTAPGLEGSSLEAYVNAFKELQ